MKLLLLVSVVGICCISSCFGSDLLLGSSYNARLMWQQKVQYMGIPFKKRVKQYFYSDPSQQIIRGLIAREASQTQASVTVTAGGVGFTYVNLRFKSERGTGLDYSVEIYA